MEHGRTNIPSVGALRAAFDADPRFVLYPLDKAVIDRSLSLDAIKEMHDRQIVATALCLQDGGEDVALLTMDVNITESGLVPVVW